MSIFPMADNKIVLKKVEIDEEVCLYIQRLDYEMRGYEAVNKAIILGTGEFSYNKELYDYHMAKYQEARAEFNLAISGLTETYAPELMDEPNLQTTVNFIAKNVTFFKYRKKGQQ